MKKNRKQKDAELLRHCAEITQGDGIDPRDLIRPSRNRRKMNRKAKQLCRQVFETLSLLFPVDEARAPSLSNVQVARVDPAPDGSRLLVIVVPDFSGTDFDTLAVLQALDELTPWLRSEIAAAICRKKVPQLVFEVSASEAT